MEAKLNKKYDVAIVGAGPVGIYTAIKLARGGLRVLVIEEDKEVGKPRFCTGLISKETFDKFGLPREAIENEFHSAWVFSPLGSKVCLKTKTIRAYVTDRAFFDRSLYNKAKNLGVEFLLNCHCSGLKIKDNAVESKITLAGIDTQVASEITILATGVKYNLHRNIGLTPPAYFLDCSQVQVSGAPGGNIEIFLGNSIAPHSFAWVVPLKENKLRIGISTRQNSLAFLRSFLGYLKSKGKINEDRAPDIMRRPIPLEPIKSTYADRILVVGDAAGQVKPTTGGGIYFGLLCADLASRTVMEAFKKKKFRAKFLSHYEISWKKEIEFDLTMSIYLRRLLTNFNDEQIEKLVQFCAQDSIQKLIEKYADFNHHGRFIQELIRKPFFWQNLYHILAAK